MCACVCFYLLNCRFASMTPMRARLAAIPIVPNAKISAASAVPPGWHWNTLVAFKLAFAALLPKRKLAPIIATAEPVTKYKLHFAIWWIFSLSPLLLCFFFDPFISFVLQQVQICVWNLFIKIDFYINYLLTCATLSNLLEILNRLKMWFF